MLGNYDPRPVQPDSLFPVFSVTKAITAGMLHWLVDNGCVIEFYECQRFIFSNQMIQILFVYFPFLGLTNLLGKNLLHTVLHTLPKTTHVFNCFGSLYLNDGCTDSLYLSIHLKIWWTMESLSQSQ